MAESLENSGASIASSSTAGVVAQAPQTSDDDGDENKQSQEEQMGGEKSDPEIVKMECPVCLQTCIHPARLPCGHVFCFLCVKGVAFKNRRCAMCRRDIPPSYLEHPQLVNGLREVEKAAKANDGFLYIVDFEHKCQIRQNDPSRIRRVKRDLATIPKKGVAGLRLETNDLTAGATPSSNSDGSLNSDDLQAETNLLQMHRNIVVDEAEEEELEEEVRRINLDGSFSSDTNNSTNNSFGEDDPIPGSSSGATGGGDMELTEAINNLNALTLREQQRSNERVGEPITIRRRIVTDLLALSDSDDDNEDNDHIIL
ncbi:hypothetical protein RP20_CCG014944 [Aedes albopictus]|nr:hypothetical protein RP20_CCG014944 [Aedes albopictus]